MDETPTLDDRRRRLLFRANHRGTKETDLLVGGFVAARVARFTDAEIDVLEAIMELPDPWLADWLTGRLPIPAAYDQPMLRAMRDAGQMGKDVLF
jgi:antitoxin CptB